MMEAARSTSASMEWSAAMVAAERARCSENMAGRAAGGKGDDAVEEEDGKA